MELQPFPPPTGPFRPPPASFISEDAIKKAFLPFLKHFYKYRYEFQPDTITTELDNVSTEGWVADGMVRFKKENGALFTCTYEATSLDKAGEVKFTQNVPYFLWDCAAFGAVAAAIFYGISYVLRFKWLVNLHWNGNAGLLLGIGLIGFLGWFFTMRNWKKYRYIYAIEQFKRYFADEQWVALGEDVFPVPHDPYLLELKDQCIYNGFGLALVGRDGQVRSLATPSRLGIYGKDRKMTQWVTRTVFYQTMSKNFQTLAGNRPKPPAEMRVLWNKIWRPVQRLVIDPVRQQIWRVAGSPAEKTSEAFNRFMRANPVQKWILAIALAIICTLSYRVLSFREEARFGDIKDYRSDRLVGNPEDEAYSLGEHDEPVPYVSIDRSGIPKQNPVPVTSPQRTTSAPDDEEAVQTINLTVEEEEESPKQQALSSQGTVKQKTAAPKSAASAPKTAAQAAPAAKDPCAALRKGWFVQDNVFSSESFAGERLTALRKAGITCASAPRNCVEKGKNGYLVYLGAPQSSESTARQKADSYEKILKKAGLLRGPLMVRHIAQ
ncbi:MAG: hypothetical protein U0U46_02160 [Saprospiraceae bacterium]